jgi:hypothetical protein
MNMCVTKDASRAKRFVTVKSLKWDKRMANRKFRRRNNAALVALEEDYIPLLAPVLTSWQVS